MPFNSQTYRSNQFRKRAWEQLAQAKDIKARAARGEAYDWEVPRIKILITLARDGMHLHLMMKPDGAA